MAAPRYKAELLSESIKFDCAGSTAITRCCCRVKRAAMQIPHTIMFAPAAISDELARSIVASAQISIARKAIVGRRGP